MPFRVEHAAFSPSLNAVLVVSTGPNALHILGTDLTDRTLALSAEPFKVAATPDGRQAVVGHEKFITHVDLAAGTVLATYPVPAAAIDIAVPGNGYCYLFPKDRSIRNVVIVDLATGAISQGPQRQSWTDVSYNTYAGAIFAVDDYERLYRYPVLGPELREGFAMPSSKEPRIGRKLWFDGSERRVITSRGTVFGVAPGRFSDVTNLGQLRLTEMDRYAAIRAVAHSQRTQQLFVLQETLNRYGDGDPTSDLYLRVYEDNYLRLTELLPVPCMADGQRQIPGHGRYVFAVNQESALLVLLHLTGTPALNDWAAGLLTL